MKQFFLFLGIIIILVGVFSLLLQNYGGTDPLILSIGDNSNSVAIPIGILFVGLFLCLIGISPSKRVGSY